MVEVTVCKRWRVMVWVMVLVEVAVTVVRASAAARRGRRRAVAMVGRCILGMDCGGAGGYPR